MSNCNNCGNDVFDEPEFSEDSSKMPMYDSNSGAVGIWCSLDSFMVSNFSVSAYMQNIKQNGH